MSKVPDPLSSQHTAHPLEEGGALPWYDVALLVGGISLYIISWVSASHAGIFQHMNAHTAASIASWTAIGAFGLNAAFALRIINHIQDIKQPEIIKRSEALESATSTWAMYHRNVGDATVMIDNVYFSLKDNTKVNIYGIFPNDHQQAKQLQSTLTHAIQNTDGSNAAIRKVLENHDLDIAIEIGDRLIVKSKKYILNMQGVTTPFAYTKPQTVILPIVSSPKQFLILATDATYDAFNISKVDQICLTAQNMSDMRDQLQKTLPQDNTEMGFHVVSIGKTPANV